MSLKKGSILILISYLVIFLLPAILISIINIRHQIIIIQTLDYVFGALLLITIVKVNNMQNELERHSVSPIKTIKWGCLGLIIALIFQIIVNIASYSKDKNIKSHNTSVLIQLAKHNPFFILAIIVGAPIMEEIVFRKVLFGNLNNWFKHQQYKHNVLLSAVISSMLFALLHNDGHLITYSGIGLLFCWLYQKTGRVQTSIISHMLMNALVTISIFIH